MNPPARAQADPDRVSLWVVLVLGLLLLAFAAITRAEDLPARASRTQSFNASGTIRSLSVENVNGDVKVTAGARFAATVEVTARARSQSLAQKVLDDTAVSFENRDGELTLVTQEPATSIRRSGKKWNVEVRRHDGQFRVEARYNITVPPEVELNASVINGNVDVRGVSGSLEVSAVNGNTTVDGARHGLAAHSVNGNVLASCAALSKDAPVKVETVNGNVTLSLPSAAAFDFSGLTMSGEIVSSFPLPAVERAEHRGEREEVRAEKDRLRSEQERVRNEIRERERARRAADGDADVEVDLSALNQSLEELGREMARMGEEISRRVTDNLNRAYAGSVNGGGASVKCATMSGNIALLAAGTTAAQAKPLIVRGSGAAVPAPPRPPSPPRPPRAPRAAGDGEEGSIVRGDISGDFKVSLPFGDVQAGKVSGAARINTHGGGIRLQEVGKDADLTSSGGEISIDTARGDLKCLTYGGDVTVGSVSGNAVLRTIGGDISVRSGGGAVVAKTGGGDITLAHVHGPVTAETAGGSVLCEITAREGAGGLSIVTGAGDVTLKLPSNYRAEVDISVCGVDPDGDYISSQFGEIAVSKKGARHYGTQSAGGKLNGGGPKVTIRTSSGRVSLKKGPPA